MTRRSPFESPAQKFLSAISQSRSDGTWVGAHILAQWTYCPRACQIELELQQDDEGEDWDNTGPRLNWSPDYDEALIIEALREQWDSVRVVCRWLLWLMLVIVVLSLVFDYRLLFILSVPIANVTVFMWGIPKVQYIAKLGRRLRAAQNCDAGPIPDPTLTEERPDNWWRLRKAGFSFVRLKERYSDPESRLVGKPFGILHYQSLRIPVFRKHRGKHEVHNQQRVRLAAYCHLIASQEGGQAPYGIVLFADSYDVIIVPTTSRSWRILADAVTGVRELIHLRTRGGLPEAAPASHCRNCPLAYPRVVRRGVTDKHLKQLPGSLTPRRGVDQRDYHSICGDRYEWLPPHARAKEKGLS